ncbi:hypothetical protein N2152v2_010482 [Parachlorella kessleri]
MIRASLMSLDDGVHVKVLSKLVRMYGVARTVAGICLINKRFAAFVRQPLAAWKTVVVRRASARGAAYLARWLACVAPAVERLKLDICEAAPYTACLAGARALKVLDVHGPKLKAAELALVGYFTSLTVLRCHCNLADGVEALGSLVSLKQLQQLSITAHKPPAGAQLPPSLSALSALESLSLTTATAQGGFDEPLLYLSLPWEWCLTATQVTSMQLDAVDLPLLREHSHGRDINGATSSSSGSSSSIFPALRRLELGSAYDRIDTTALGCCQTLEHLKIELGQTGTAVWALIAQLSQLQTLAMHSCYVDAEADVDEGGEPLPLPQSLSSLTSLTTLDIKKSNFHPAMAQLPAVREMRLCDQSKEFQRVAGWPLPEGPWLRNLEALIILYGGIGSIEAALRQATRLHTLCIQNCYWLRLRRPELQLLLRLPLRTLMLRRSPQSMYVPEPLLDEESVCVVEELSKALKPGVFKLICSY